MSEQLGRGHVSIGADLRELHAKMAEAKGLSAKTMQEIGAQRAEPKIDLDTKALVRKKQQVKAEMADIAKMRAEATADLDKSLFDRRLAELQAELGLIDRNIEIVVDLDRRGLGRARKELHDLHNEFNDGNDRIGNWLRSLSRVRIHLGVASLTLKQFGLALITLGPIIDGLIALISGLIGALAEGLVGAGLFAASGITALGITFFGLRAAIKPATEEVGLARDAWAKYNETVSEFGKNSEEARDAHKELETVLKNIDPRAASVARQMEHIRSEYERMTAPARGEFFQTMGAGLRLVDRLMPGFADRMNQIAATLGDSLRQQFQRLGTDPQVEHALDQLLRNFDQALPAAIRGTVNMMIALGNVMSSVSRHFGGAAQGFAGWSRDLLRATEDTRSLDRWVDGLMNSLSSVGNFMSSLGGTLWAFFTAGSDEGIRVLDKWSKGLDRITEDIKAGALDEWFANAVPTAEEFLTLIGNAGELILNIAEAFRPVMDALLTITNLAADFVNTIGDIPVLGGTLLDAAGFVAAGAIILSIIGKIRLGLLGLSGISLASALGGAGAGAAAGGGLFAGLSRGLGAIARFAGPIGLVVTAVAALNELGGDLPDSFKPGFADEMIAKIKETTYSLGELESKANDLDLEGPAAGMQANLKEMLDAVKGAGGAVKKELGNLALDEELDISDISDAFQTFAASDLPAARREIMGLASQVGRLGGAKGVVKIFAESGSAEETIRRLKALLQSVTQRRRLELVANLDNVMNGLREVDEQAGKASRKRTVPIVEKGVSGVIAGMLSIIRLNIPGKTVNVDGNTSPFYSSVGAIPSIVKTVSVVVNAIGKGANALLGGRTGGTLTLSGPDRVSDRVPGFATGGGYVTKPAFVVGEEAPQHPEFVIATNPAYRQDNIRYWLQAARAMGIPGFAKGKGRGGSHMPATLDALTGPRSQYMAFHRRIDNVDARFQTKQREMNIDLQAGRTPAVTFESLVDFKQTQLGLVRDLDKYITTDLIRRMEKMLRRTKPGKFGKNKRGEVRSRLDAIRDALPDLRDEASDLDEDAANLRLDIQELRDQKAAGGAAAALEQFGASQARFDLFKEFAGNFSPIAAAFSSNASRFGTGFNPQPAPPSTMSFAASSGSGGSTTILNQTNNFATVPPDPHTWSQDTAFELSTI